MSSVDKLIAVETPKEFIGKVIDVEMSAPRTIIAGGVAALIVEVFGYEVPIRVGSGITYEERLSMATNSPIGKYIVFDAFYVDSFEHLNAIKGKEYINIPTFKQFI